MWLYAIRFCSQLFIIHLHIRTVEGLGGTLLSSNMAPLLPSHRVTGSGTSPGFSGTRYRPMTLKTDCGPHRADNADRLHTQTVFLLADMISYERRYQSCSGHGRNPFHWHLSKKCWDSSFIRQCYSTTMFGIICTLLPLTYQLHRRAEPPSDSAGRCH